jgi:amphi-Trp domain-containing protein
MQRTNQVSLAEAIDELTAILDRINAGEPVEAGGLKVKPGDPVALEIEVEASNGGREIEFEIKWPYLGPLTLTEALAQVRDFARSLESGVVEIRGRTFPIGGTVAADLELEGTPQRGEFEWEIEWPASNGIALNTAASQLAEAAAKIQSAGGISFAGREIGMSELVTLRIEAEGNASEGELEVEVNWPHIPKRSLAEAVRDVRSVLDQLRSGAAHIDGSDVKIDGPVEVDIELSGDDTEGELELKIVW